MSQTRKGFIKDWNGNYIFPITRGELILDNNGNPAFQSEQFLAVDGHPGLVTSAEREIIQNLNSGEKNIADIYNKLEFINTGLKINENTISFYNESEQTPLNITTSDELEISVENNNINISLLETLNNKIIKNSVLNNCVTSTSDIGNNDLSIVNKAYVDSIFRSFVEVATGGLKFGGKLDSITDAENALNNVANINNYYKVTTGFILTADKLHYTNNNTFINIGDTLIIYNNNENIKFVHIPSGDEITTITVKGDSEANNTLTNAVNNVTFRFSDIFSVKNEPINSNVAYISFPQASMTQSGYLSADDYKTFKSGSKSELKLINGISSEYNPILRYDNGTIKDITYQGIGGISVRKNNDSIEFSVINESVEQDVPQINNPRKVKYLTITNGYKFEVNLGSVNEDGSINDGLTDFSQFNKLTKVVADLALASIGYESINYTLNGQESELELYKYGGNNLKSAINIII